MDLLSLLKQVPGETATRGMAMTTPKDLRMPTGNSMGGSNLGAAGEPVTNGPSGDLPLRPGTDSSGTLPLRQALMRNAVHRSNSTASPMGLLL
jgi:hypothetical protein